MFGLDPQKVAIGGMLMRVGGGDDECLQASPSPSIYPRHGPENLLVSREGVLKIVDFGLSRGQGFGDRRGTPRSANPLGKKSK